MTRSRRPGTADTKRSKPIDLGLALSVYSRDADGGLVELGDSGLPDAPVAARGPRPTEH